MALKTTLNDTNFGVGDTVIITQEINERGKKRLQAFEGMVIAIGGHGEGKSITVRRVGAAQIGIEKIFPLNSQVIQAIEVIRPGTEGVRQAKLYYTREKHKREIETIYSHQRRRSEKNDSANKKIAKKASKSKPNTKSNLKPKSKAKSRPKK